MDRDGVTVQVPPMTPQGSVLLTDGEMREFQQDFEIIKGVAQNFAIAVIALVALFAEPGTDEVLIPKEILERVEGSQLELSKKDDNLVVKIVSRAPALVVVN